MVRCELCHSEFQFGPHRYDGKHIARYQMTVCRTCYQANHDGWAPAWEERVLAVLKEKGLPVPERNAEGYLPRD